MSDVVDLTGPDPEPSEDRMTEAAVLAPEDHELDIALRPRSLAEFVGQDRVKEQLALLLQAARERGEQYLLERRLLRRLSTGEVIDPKYTQFSFPPGWHYDILRGLDYFRATGAKPDDRVDVVEDLEQVLVVGLPRLEPGAIVVGGEITRAWGLIEPIISQGAKGSLLGPRVSTIPIRRSAFEVRPSLKGAVTLVLNELLSVPPVG